MGKQGVKIEIMDTTLRDGEQTSGVSFVPHEKLMIARLLLEDLKVDRVEVASARVSDGEFEAVKMICDWAARRNLLHKVEVLGFVDGHTSVDWIQHTGCRVINLLCKGSLKHCTQQLKKSPEEHIEDIINVVRYADEQDIAVNVYLEDWSNGMKDSPEYVFQLMEGLKHTSIKRYMLPDTLGILNPLQVIEYMRKMKKHYPNMHFDFHAHNDYDLAVSNVLAAVLSGAKGLHTTINGLGERAGNAPLSSVQAILKDHFNAVTNIDESRLNDVSRVVESYSGIVIPANKPIVGENVFTQVAGVHADGDNKNNLYCNDLLPERFGRKREYALGKTSGKANIRKNLEDLGLTLDEIRDYYNDSTDLMPLIRRMEEMRDQLNLNIEKLYERAKVSSAQVKERVDAARAIQSRRFEGTGIPCNAQMTPPMVGRFCELDSRCDALMKSAFERMGLTARSHDRVLRVARTIADLDGAEHIGVEHLSEAIQYRNTDILKG